MSSYVQSFLEEFRVYLLRFQIVKENFDMTVKNISTDMIV